MSLPALICRVVLGLCLTMAGAWLAQRRVGNGGRAHVVWSLAAGAAWDAKITVFDMAWGTFVTAIGATAGVFAVKLAKV